MTNLRLVVAVRQLRLEPVERLGGRRVDSAQHREVQRHEVAEELGLLSEAPTRGQAAELREREREAEAMEDSPGAVVHVDEPWDGYQRMAAADVVDRLRVADEATKAVVLLYEEQHRARKSVLAAARGDG